MIFRFTKIAHWFLFHNNNILLSEDNIDNYSLLQLKDPKTLNIEIELPILFDTYNNKKCFLAKVINPDQIPNNSIQFKQRSLIWALISLKQHDMINMTFQKKIACPN